MLDSLAFQRTNFFTSGIAGAVSFSDLQELLHADHSDFWSWHDLLSNPRLENFRIIARALQVNLNLLVGTELSVEEYKKVWVLLRDIVLLGESDPSLPNRFLRPYLNSLQVQDEQWHAQGCLIVQAHTTIVALEGSNYGVLLLERMSARGDNETFEEAFLPPPTPDPEELVELDMGPGLTDPWIIIEGAVPRSVLETDIEHLGMQQRGYNALRKAQIEKVGQLFTLTADDLLSLPTFGPASLENLQDSVIEFFRQHAPTVRVERSN